MSWEVIDDTEKDAFSPMSGKLMKKYRDHTQFLQWHSQPCAHGWYSQDTTVDVEELWHRWSILLTQPTPNAVLDTADNTRLRVLNYVRYSQPSGLKGKAEFRLYNNTAGVYGPTVTITSDVNGTSTFTAFFPLEVSWNNSLPAALYGEYHTISAYVKEIENITGLRWGFGFSTEEYLNEEYQLLTSRAAGMVVTAAPR